MSRELNFVCPECGCDRFYEDITVRNYLKPYKTDKAGMNWEIVSEDNDNYETTQVFCDDCGLEVELSNEEGVVSAI